MHLRSKWDICIANNIDFYFRNALRNKRYLNRGSLKMPSIDFGFRELEIFSKVVELGSFSKAAEAVFLV